MIKTKKSFYPCKNWICHQLWQMSIKPFSKINQKYTPHKGDIGILKELANQSIYPPILDFILDNLKKTNLPRVITLKDKHLPDFGSLLFNRIVIEKLMVTTNLSFSAKDQLKTIDNGSFAGELTIKQIKDFRFYFWYFLQGQLKAADDALINIKNPGKLVQLYRLHLDGKISEDVLFYYIYQSPVNSHLVKTSRNIINYHVDQIETYPRVYNLDLAEQKLRVLLTIINIAERNNKLEAE